MSKEPGPPILSDNAAKLEPLILRDQKVWTTLLVQPGFDYRHAIFKDQGNIDEYSESGKICTSNPGV